jgi:hypothetical protein
MRSKPRSPAAKRLPSKTRSAISCLRPPISRVISAPIPKVRLRRTNAKFERRFGFIEKGIARRGGTLAVASLAEMDALWNKAKEGE